MSEETEIKTDHVPQLQPRGRKRTRPVTEASDIIKALGEKNAALEKQLENVMTMLLTKASEPAATGYMLPPKPLPVARPRGYEFELERKKPEEGVTRPDVYVKTVPERWNNENEPDPRFCVFCSAQTADGTARLAKKANMAIVYDEPDLQGDIEFTDEQVRRIQRLHKDHLREVHSYESSKNGALRRLYKNHFDLDARRRGRVPDCVKFRTTGRPNDKEKEVALTAEEANALNLKQWEANCASALRNQQGR